MVDKQTEMKMTKTPEQERAAIVAFIEAKANAFAFHGNKIKSSHHIAAAAELILAAEQVQAGDHHNDR